MAFTGFDDRYQGYQVRQLYVVGRDGGGRRSLTVGLDRDVQDPTWSRDGRGLFFKYDDHGNGRIGYVALEGGAVRTLASDVGSSPVEKKLSTCAGVMVPTGSTSPGPRWS